MRTLPSLTALSFILAVAAPAAAATLTVGTGQMYATPCAAIGAAKANDIVEISPGTYTDTCSINAAGLTVRGVNGQPKIDLTDGTPSGDKAIYVIEADNVTIENLELMGAQVSAGDGENGAAIRIDANNLTVRGCYIHDNQDGILGQSAQPGGTLLVESTEFSHNAMGNGCDDTALGDSCTHNVYIGANIQTFTFQYNWSHNLATDTPDKGHLLKSRAQQTFVLYNRLTGETDTDSYEIDIPQGGLAVVVGNMVEKPTMSGNGTTLAYAEEGLTNADKRIFVANNTFVNNHGGNGPFLNITHGGVLVAHNNLFVGMGTPSSTGALSADNLSGIDPLFVNAAGYDYQLQAGSPAIGKGVAPGSADTFSLTPIEEYGQPLQKVARTDSGKTVGAFEYPAPVGTGSGGGSSTGTGGGSGGSTVTSGGTNTSTTTGAGGASGTSSAAGATATGSTVSGSGVGGSSGASAPADGSPEADGGCGCTLPGGTSPNGTPAAALLGAVAFLISRRRHTRV